MAKIVQTITMKVTNKFDHAKALEEIKRVKAAVAPHEIGVACHLAIEAGPASGYATVSFLFPSAVKWAELVDGKKDTLQSFRQRILENNGDIVSTSLLQEIEL